MGRNPWTLAIAATLVVVQLALAAWVASLDWWWSIAAAATLGAHVVHALYAVMHEATHRLIVRSAWGNKLTTLLSNVPLLAPFGIALSHYHLVHHRRLGEWGRDPDMPAAWERRMFTGGALSKLAYACSFPFLQLLRPVDPADRIAVTDRWMIANVVVQLGATSTIFWLLGWEALLYLALSVYFWSGPHPVLFARFVQEHFTTSDDGEETHSYYGPLNRLTLNVGLHVEHHDLANIPWNRLPALSRIASRFYASRTRHTSWWRLFRQYLLDPRIKPENRVSRATGGGVAEASPSTRALVQSTSSKNVRLASRLPLRTLLR